MSELPDFTQLDRDAEDYKQQQIEKFEKVVREVVNNAFKEMQRNFELKEYEETRMGDGYRESTFINEAVENVKRDLCKNNSFHIKRFYGMGTVKFLIQYDRFAPS